MMHFGHDPRVPTEISGVTSSALAIAGLLLSGCGDTSAGTINHVPGSVTVAATANITAAFPGEVAGLRFGITREDARGVCDAAGLKVHLHQREFPGVGAISAITCIGLLKADSLGEFAYVEGLFCNDSLCVTKLAAYDGARFDSLRDAIVTKYGPVGADHSNVPTDCTATKLVRCLQDGTAQKLLVWSWTAGFPANIASMIRLVHTASAQGEYVFLFFCDARGSELIRRTAQRGAP